ncbi:MAG: SDR family NAD(P)-dependent oxidoreductase [Novosphingobium sp.]
MGKSQQQRIYRTDQSPRSVAGAAVLITGAASGMGAAAARLFADEGAWVAVTDRDADGARRVADEILQAGGMAHAWPLDVADREAVNAVVADVAERFEGLDCLINNAGVSSYTDIDGSDYEDVWERSIAIMLVSIPRAVRAALPALRRSPFPRILNIASTEACMASSRLSPYAAAKAGVTGITRSLAVELGREGITCNCILPGPIETGLTQDIAEENKLVFSRKRTALRRYGRPEEVAHIMLSLCLPAASYITGAVVPVDGGMMIRSH